MATKAKKLTALWSVTTKKDFKAIDNWGIPKGTRLFITIDTAPRHPRDGYQLLVAGVDNGSGVLDLMPETCFRDTEIADLKRVKPAEDPMS